MSSLHVDFHTNRAHSNIWLGALLRSGGVGGDESEENGSFAVWEGREGGREGWQRGRDRRPQPSSTKTAITHHGSGSRIVPALTLGCYNKTMQGHNVPIHHQHSHDCWGNTSAPPPLLSQCEIQRPTLFRWFTILWLNIRWKRRCDSRWQLSSCWYCF